MPPEPLEGLFVERLQTPAFAFDPHAEVRDGVEVDALAKLDLKPIEDSTPEEARESMRSRMTALGPFDEVAAVGESTACP